MARTKIHSDNNLQTGSDYLEYHIRMYVETLLWLRDHECDANREIYYWNAILEDNLIHARLLIDFVCKTQARSDDILAIDYFYIQ